MRTFPLEERYGFLWIWMGEGPAKPELLPDFGELDRGHPHGLAHTYMHMKANYELIIDNVMDLSHIDHVHGEIITMKIQAMHTAFETEDGPIIQAVHEEMGTTDFFSLNPVLMSNDVAPVKVRRLLKRLIAHDSRI